MLQRTALSRQTGVVLISALLLLVVMTIMTVSLFHSFGIQEKIAGNVREKQRALQAAVSAQSYGEYWLANQSEAPKAVSASIASEADVSCSTLVDANTGSGFAAGQICNNPLATAIGVAANQWPSSGNDYGIVYTLPNMNVTGSVVNTSVNDVYYKRPRIYIYDMGAAAGSALRSEVYKVDAYGYGLTSTAVAVVESVITISSQSSAGDGP
jgi:type IV pilus assembly protein PilX